MGADDRLVEPTVLTVAGAAAAIAEGRLGAEELTRVLIERIEAAEPALHAWAYFDPEHALRQARAADQARKAGAPLGALHGVPIAIDDLIDTADQPTELGTPLYAGRRPESDATAVLLLRAAGAIILGKTATAELGAGAPPATVHPHDPSRTPGGACGGAAAAVAAAMAPAALGVQTGGAVIAAASYCGIYGFKPTRGLISQRGTLDCSARLNQVGVLATNVEDLALVAETHAAYDPGDLEMRPHAAAQLWRIATSEPPLPPRFCFLPPPGWDTADDPTRDAYAELAAFLGPQASEAALPAAFAKVAEIHRTVRDADLAVALASEQERASDRLSPTLRALIERGQAVRAGDYIRALALIPRLNAALAPLFEAFDAILTPAVPGEAPPLSQGPDDPIFCSPWTLCGMPTVSLPLLQGENGLPVGVQLVGPQGDDARMLRSARWLASAVLRPKRGRKSGRRPG